MTKQEKNEAIAEILGFKKTMVSGNTTYTEVDGHKEYNYLSAGTSNYRCPDFIEQIEDRRNIKKIIQGWE